MLKISFFHTNTHTEMFALLVNCVTITTNYTLLKTMPVIDQALLQFIDVIHLAD